MLRNLLGFAVFAVVAIFLLKVVFGLFGLVLGLLGGFFPALRAARLPVAEALRAA